MQRVNIYLDDEAIEYLKKWKSETGASRSAIIRICVKEKYKEKFGKQDNCKSKKSRGKN